MLLHPSAFAAELTAGGVDVGAEGAADGCSDALGFQDGGEFFDGIPSRMDESRLLDLIHGDQIDVDGHCGILRAAVSFRGAA